MEGLLDRFAEEQKMVSAASQAANTELEQREREFEEEQQRFAEAAVKLGKEKAALEVRCLSVSFVLYIKSHILRLSGSDSWKKSGRGRCKLCLQIFQPCCLRNLLPLRLIWSTIYHPQMSPWKNHPTT